MKKRFVVLSVLLLFFSGLIILAADAADDYKVIKNAVNAPTAPRAGQKNVQWLKVLVTGRDGAQEKVKISLPVSLVEMMLAGCRETKFNVERGCDIDIRRIWNDLKAAGPLALVEVEDHGETVKIWLE
jgi:hypothetical protein